MPLLPLVQLGMAKICTSLYRSHIFSLKYQCLLEIEKRQSSSANTRVDYMLGYIDQIVLRDPSEGLVKLSTQVEGVIPETTKLDHVANNFPYDLGKSQSDL